MSGRDAELASFVAALRAEVTARAQGAAARAAGLVLDRLAAPGAPGTGGSETLPVVARWMAPALGSGAPVARALAPLVPRLAFRRRAGSDPANATFHHGHANAMILGPGGIEHRADVWVGLTLMAPGVTYIDHDHPPEEVYLALSPGEWWNAAMDWTDPGAGGLIYNPPGIRHAMRSGAGPFLAIWMLPL